jgi:hypothetical protein
MRLSCESFNKQAGFEPLTGHVHKEYAMNIYQGLLFQSGHIADPKLALSLAQSEAASEASVQATSAGAHTLAERLRWILEELVLLGGRPVSREHFDDIDEPFPALHPCH